MEVKKIIKNSDRQGKPYNDDIPLQHQIRTLRVLLLASVIVGVLNTIHLQNLYSDVHSHHRTSAVLVGQLREQYREMTDMAQQIFDGHQEMAQMLQEMSEFRQKVLGFLQEMLEHPKDILQLTEEIYNILIDFEIR
ncbi:hypothetical protein D7X48_18055 [bacterium D16-50]|nr:hypothetical protein D7X48_18055 [bacterium D16-50]